MRAVCGSATGGEMSEWACVSGGIGVRVRKNLHCDCVGARAACAALPASVKSLRKKTNPADSPSMASRHLLGLVLWLVAVAHACVDDDCNYFDCG